MSPAISLVKPLAKSIRPCPYCDHISPADSKFCSDCGAALHLLPCPKCGAVNDITTTDTCYRCHGELHERNPDALLLPAVPAEPEPVTAQLEPIASESSGRQRPHGLVVLIVLLAFAAGSYYAFRQRGTLELSGPAGPAAEVKGRVNPGTASSPIRPAETAPAVPDSPAKVNTTNAPAQFTPEKAAAAPLPVPPVSPAPTTRAALPVKTPAVTAVPAATTTDSARSRSDAARGLDNRPPNIGPCTDAVAALGLCTPEPTPPKR